MIDLGISFQPKQTKVFQAWERGKFTRIGFGGARGGSKSGGGRRFMLLRRLKYDNTTGLILRRTYPELYKSHLVKLFAEFPETRKWWREQSKELICPNGSRLFFGSAEHESDMAQYYSSEFADIMFDEAQEFSQSEIEKAAGSNRCTTNSKIVPAMLFTFMPGLSETGLPPKGLDYLKRVFVEGKQRGDETRHKWVFVQAFAWDNVEWARRPLEEDGVSAEEFYSWSFERRREYFIDRTDFGKTLAGLTNQNLREAWLDGKWGAFQGQYFSNYSYERTTVPHEDIRIERWHRLWLSGDWGHDHPACFHWHSEDENGVITTFKEFWGREMSERAMGEGISTRSVGMDLKRFWLSWDAFGKLDKRTQQPITKLIANHLSENIPDPIPADASPGARISGWRAMSGRIDDDTWKISRKCEKLIECLPVLVRDMQRNSEDVLKVDYSENFIGDDPADSARHGIQHELRPSVRPKEVRVLERLTKLAKERNVSVEKMDPTNRARIVNALIASEEKREKSHRTYKPIFRPRHFQ